MKLSTKGWIGLVLFLELLAGELKACVPQINWGASISFCQGNSFTLNAFNPNSSYIWSTGATSSSILISTSGTYWVQVTNACGSASDTIVVTVDQPINLNLGADRNICSSFPTVLKAPYGASTSYLWSTGSTQDSISTTQSGTYWVQATNACGTYTDTVVLTAQYPPAVILGQDLNICDTNAVTITVDGGVSGSLLWSDGSTGYGITVSQSGDYWVRIANACGIFQDTITITYLIQGKIFPFDSLALCSGSSVSLTPGVNASAYLWSTGATSPTIQVSTPGQVWVRLNTPCGQIFDTVYVTPSSIATVDLGSDTIICASNPITIDAGNPGSQYIWSNGQNTRSINVSSSGTFWVGVNNGCGYVYDTINVTANPQPSPTIADTIYVCNAAGSPIQDAGYWGPQTTYLWSNGATTRLGGSYLPGNHWVQVSNVCDTITHHFSVKSVGLPNLDLGPDTSTCSSSFLLDPKLSRFENKFLWSNGSTSHRINVTSTGLYWVRVTNSCGVYYDSIIVIINALPSYIQEDTLTKCAGSSRLLVMNFVSGTNYLWSTGGTTNYTMAHTPGLYDVMAWHNCDTIYDTVFVEDVHPLNVDLGPDTLICRPDVLIFDLSDLKSDSIIWNGSIRANRFNATANGLHWVQVYNACGMFSDSVIVTVDRAPRAVLRDTAYCYNSSVTLNAYQPNVATYQWSTGATGASISVNQTGWYYVDMNNQCGSLRDSVYVRIDYNLPAIDLGPDTLFCAGTLSLEPRAIPGAYYLWHNGDTSRVFNVSSTGQYYVKVYNACNSVWDTINVIVTGPPSVTLGNSVRFCRGSTLNLNAQNPGCSYLWNTGDTSQSISINDPGIYWVTITNDCGSVTDSIHVIVEDPITNLDLGRDTSICRGDSILLDTKLTGVSTKWQNGSGTTSIYVKESGRYWVEITNTCGTWEDTIIVTVLDVPVFDLGMDPVLCSTGNGLTIQGPDSLSSYLWNTGDTTRNLLVTTPGKYWLTAGNKCFSSTDTVRVTEDFPLIIDLGPDTSLCEGEILSLDLNLSGSPQIRWSDGSTGSHLDITSSGTYFVTATNACGVFSDTINVVFDEYLDPDLEELIVCRDDSLAVDLRDFDGEFVWFDGSDSKLRYLSEEGVYSIFITNRCGTFSKDYQVSISNCDCPFYTANAFTPNNDGLNDRFVVTHSCDLTEFRLQIFNRWGKMVYDGTDDSEGWDGTFSGEPMPPGIYTYSVSYYWDVYGDRYMRYKTGTLTLVR